MYWEIPTSPAKSLKLQPNGLAAYTQQPHTPNPRPNPEPYNLRARRPRQALGHLRSLYGFGVPLQQDQHLCLVARVKRS